MAAALLIVGNKNYSSWSLRPFMAMAMADIPFDDKVIPFGNPKFAKAIKRYSSAGLVPVLVHNGITIWDTLAIMEYLAETWPDKNLWPKNRAARAMARSACAEMHSGYRSLRDACPMNLRRAVKAVAMSVAVLKDVERIEFLWRECRKAHGKGGPFLFGKFGIADAMFTPIVARLDTFDIKVASDTQHYMNAILATPAFHEWKAAALKEKWIVAEDEVD